MSVTARPAARRGVRRLIIDGLASFEPGDVRERIVRFWSALAKLRAHWAEQAIIKAPPHSQPPSEIDPCG